MNAKNGMPLPGVKLKKTKPVKVRASTTNAPIAYQGSKKIKTAPTLGRDDNVTYG